MAILQEVEARLEHGAREIMLLGQNVNAWHGEMPQGKTGNLGELCYLLCDRLPKLKRLRYATSHPRDMHDTLIDAHRDLPQLMPWLHLPVQSGSDRVLQAMNRKHSVDDYRRIIADLRDARADIVFSSDFIVGFPCETDKDFAQTIELISDIGYAQAYSFKYSPRHGTPSAALENQVPEEVKDERLRGIQQLLDSQQQAFNLSVEGSIQPILFEKPGRYEGQIVGRTPHMQPVYIDGKKDMIGQIHKCRITGRSRFGLKAELLSKQSAVEFC
jgi:tRNA-2-methylthio-N6-dimethylallyladenosine synthase